MPRGSMLAPVLLTAAALISCSVPTDRNLTREQLQDQIVEKVTQQSGAPPDSVSCPGDLTATVGASLDCTLADGGQQRRVSVTVGGAEGDRIELHIQQRIAEKTVTEQIADQVNRQIGRAPEWVSCPGDLSADSGATLRCELRDSGQTYGVTVTTVHRGGVTFDIRVDQQPQ